MAPNLPSLSGTVCSADLLVHCRSIKHNGASLYAYISCVVLSFKDLLSVLLLLLLLLLPSPTLLLPLSSSIALYLCLLNPWPRRNQYSI